MKLIGIYKITSPSGKIYIGQSIDILSRWESHRRTMSNGKTYLVNSFKKYGFDNHTFEIILQCDREELDKLEKFYIDVYNTFNTKHGLNLQSGGGKYYTSEKTKIKKSKSAKESGVGKWNLGKKRTDEFKQKMSNRLSGSQVGEKNICYGRPISESRRAALIKNIKNNPNYGMKGKKFSEESKRKISESLKGNIPWNKGLKIKKEQSN